jgi:hypothetical protein
MQCQADAITERAAQRAQARQQMTDADRKRAQKQLEDETKAGFEAIQKEAAKGK